MKEKKIHQSVPLYTIISKKFDFTGKIHGWIGSILVGLFLKTVNTQHFLTVVLYL